MKVLLDTHFLLWIVLDVPRVDEFPWLDRYRPWGVSPVSFLEVTFLGEVGRLEVRHPGFVDAISSDPASWSTSPPCSLSSRRPSR